MKSAKLSERRIWRDWQVLCEDIGERRAGTAGEKRAAEHIARAMTTAGLTVRTEEFPCTSLRSARTRVQARIGRSWRTFPSTTYVGTSATPGKKAVEGELVWLEMPESSARLNPGSLRGKIALIFGSLATRALDQQRIVAAAPAAVLHIDERLPFEWIKQDGTIAYWVKRYGTPPLATVPYQVAWRWRLAGVSRVRVRVEVNQVQARSQNVIGEIIGTDPALPPIFFGAHHDTQCYNPGADDNASGVVAILELARVLAASRHRRTLRFISFGTEEQLSVGSAAYARAHPRATRQAGLMVNFDSIASPLGHFEVSCIGTDSLARHVLGRLAKRGVDVLMPRAVTPFVDNFPFNRAGVPSLLFHRSNFPGGRWQHHSIHDTLENVSLAETARLLRAVLPLIAELAGQVRWPFAGGLTAEQRRDARRLGRELFGPS